MKLKFKNQDFQTEAVNSVADLFKGQEKANTTFSVDENAQQITSFKMSWDMVTSS